MSDAAHREDRRSTLASPSPDPRDAGTLLDQAEAALKDPTRAEQQAMGAFALLSHAEADAGGRNFDLVLRAAWVILRSRCVTGRLSAAEDAYLMALPFLGAAPPIGVGRATLLSGLARLRWTQGRLDEAAALFAHAANIFGEALERHGQAACRALGGFLWAEVAPGLAGAQLAYPPIEVDLPPALAVRCLLLHAWCHLRLRRIEAGRHLLRAARELYDRAPGAGEETFRTWWEARIAALDGQPDQAQEQLDAVRRRLLAEGSFVEAARASLDLLVLRVEAGRLDSLSQLAPDLLDAFQCQRWAFPPAVALDWLAIQAAQPSVQLGPLVASIRHHLSTLRRSPRDRPDLIADLRDLADRLLVAAHRDRSRAAAQEVDPAESAP
ncbi:MAG TPA: hypothetical protein VN999_05145 [Thermoanaerobaculia bacterium]|nr:hypothetical protein [Thermoanaerobaculia bacterium]